MSLRLPYSFSGRFRTPPRPRRTNMITTLSLGRCSARAGPKSSRASTGRRSQNSCRWTRPSLWTRSRPSPPQASLRLPCVRGRARPGARAGAHASMAMTPGASSNVNASTPGSRHLLARHDSAARIKASQAASVLTQVDPQHGDGRLGHRSVYTFPLPASGAQENWRFPRPPSRCLACSRTFQSSDVSCPHQVTSPSAVSSIMAVLASPT